MTWWTLLAPAASQPQAIPAGTTGLVLVDATAGPIAATLPPVLGAGPLHFVRRDASANVVTLAPAGTDSVTPAGPLAPAVVLAPGDAIALLPAGPGVWQLGESALEVIVREATVAALLAFGTLAGTAIESERVDPVAAADMPRLNIQADVDAESVGTGGTAPAFDVTLHLVVHALVARARIADAKAALDLLLIQVRDCLLGDPVWIGLTAQVKAVLTTRTFKGEQDQVVGDGRLKFTLAWTEIYRPRITQPLALITLTTDPPAGTQAIAASVTLAV